ncbi:MAG: putative membrane protein [Alphaproteobacteria bacterium]
MTSREKMSEMIVYELIGIGWLFFCWVSYTIITDHSRYSRTNLIGSIAKQREFWIKRMLARDNRMVDIQVINSLLDVVRFLASTSILIVAGLLALLGATDKATALIMDLPFAAPVVREVWEGKILLLVLIFVYAFFKFMWSMRQYTYCSVMIGAAPPPGAPEAENASSIMAISRIATLVARHSNRGTRAYYFGLAALSWFVHPWLLIPGALWVVMVLYRREFHSRTLAHIRRSQDGMADVDHSD